jgi:hypothetical protein
VSRRVDGGAKGDLLLCFFEIRTFADTGRLSTIAPYIHRVRCFTETRTRGDFAVNAAR